MNVFFKKVSVTLVLTDLVGWLWSPKKPCQKGIGIETKCAKLILQFTPTGSLKWLIVSEITQFWIVSIPKGDRQLTFCSLQMFKSFDATQVRTGLPFLGYKRGTKTDLFVLYLHTKPLLPVFFIIPAKSEEKVDQKYWSCHQPQVVLRCWTGLLFLLKKIPFSPNPLPAALTI